MSQPLLSMKNVDKAFAGVPALKGAELEILAGEVHGLIGQNGAGKSTLIKVLTGVYRRDAGDISFDGSPSVIASPATAQVAGIATIYQELNLVPLRSVTENVTMGYEPKLVGPIIDWRTAHRRTRDILQRFSIDIDVRRPLGDYSTAIQQLVAIARAVSLKAKLVIMDEPTSSLDEREVEVLFRVVRELKASGVSILYVSHFLDELFEICDRVTVMRDGRTTAIKPIAATNKLDLIADMLGRDVAEIEAGGMTELDASGVKDTPVLLATKELRSGNRLRGVDIEIREGEIVGLGGLLGSGRTEAARALFGADTLTSGSVSFKGKSESMASPRAAISAGIGFLTEDRKAEGIIPAMSVRENVTLALLPKLTKGLRVAARDERRIVEDFITSLGIKTSDMDQPIRELSGGNQQKVLLARWLAIEPDLLLLDEPTRGVDVGAKLEIQSIIRRFVEAGNGVLMISSEFEEIVEGADRIVVLIDGRSVKELHNPGVTEDTLLHAIAHHSDTDAPYAEAGG